VNISANYIRMQRLTLGGQLGAISTELGLRRRELILRAIVILIFAAALAANAMKVYAADDWEAVGSTTPEDRSDTGNPVPSAGNATSEETPPSNLVCEEAARPASAEIQSMIARINQLWGTRFHVYETVAPEQPHAALGGCIFYNRQALATVMVGRLDVNDPKVVTPLLWAIMAHEAGHEMHHDFGSSRASVAAQDKELEADRFAGYTLEKLGIPATDLTPFWTMAGDEFGAGGGYKHGSSAERVAAFKQGWHLAEWNRAENSVSVRSALDEPVAPDNPESAPQ
jgi:hypothetical protein